MDAADERDLLETLLLHDDTSVADRLRLMERLDKLPANGVNASAAWRGVVADVEAMDDAALDVALAGYFNPGFVEQPKPIKIHPTEREAMPIVRRMLRGWAKGKRPDLDPDAPDDPRGMPQPPQESAHAEPEPRAEPEPVDPLSYLTAEEIRRHGPQAIEVGQSRHRIKLWREEQALMEVVEQRPQMPRTGPDAQAVDPAAWRRWGGGHDVWKDDD